MPVAPLGADGHGGALTLLRERAVAAGAVLAPAEDDALREICRREKSDIGAMIRRIEAQSRGTGEDAVDASGGRTSAVRVFIVQYYRALAETSSGSEASQPPPAASSN